MERQTKQTEYKSFGGGVKDVDTKGRVVTGYFAAFNNIDADGDKIIKGAFTKTVNERGPLAANDIFHLKQHNWLHVMGKPSLLKEDDNGLYFETPFEKTNEANDVLTLYEAGVYKEHSIGYRLVDFNSILKPGSKDEIDHWELRELKLYEGSTVAIGANRSTPFTGLKSGTDEWLNDLVKEMDVCIAIFKQRNLTDDTYIRAEKRMAQIKAELSTFDFKPVKPLKEKEPEAADLAGLKEAIKQLKTTIKN